MLEVGEGNQTEQRMVVLYVAKGMTIEAAITTLQNKNRESKQKKVDGEANLRINFRV